MLLQISASRDLGLRPLGLGAAQGMRRWGVVGLLLRYGIWFPTRISWTSWVSMWSSSSVHSLRFKALLYCWNFCRHWKALRLVFPRPNRNEWASVGFTLHMQRCPETALQGLPGDREPELQVALYNRALLFRLLGSDSLLDHGRDPEQKQFREGSMACKRNNCVANPSIWEPEAGKVP